MSMRYREKTIESMQLADAPYVVIDWVLGNYCNYQCSYCWPEAHDGTDRVPPIDDVMRSNIKHLVDQMLSVPENSGKDVVFTLSGGEPTMYHDMDELLDFLSEIGKVWVITNGSRTLNWWERNGHKFDDVLISYHTKSAEYDHVSAVIKSMLGKQWLSLHVMVNPNDFEQAVDIYKRFSSEFDDQPVNIMYKLIMDVNTGQTLPYTAEQMQVLDSLPRHRANMPRRVFERVVMNLEDGAAVEWSHDVPKDLSGSFRDYDCYAHHQFITVDRQGRVGMHACRQHWHDRISVYNPQFKDKFKLSHDAITCERDWCGCLGLYQTNKLRIADLSQRPVRDQNFIPW